MPGPRSLRDPNATFFAPAAVASEEELARSVRQIGESPLLTRVLESVGGVLLLLNPDRQVLALNGGALGALNLEAAARIVGLRPGDALGCAKVQETPNGCGTGRACASCGLAKALTDAQLNQRTAEYESTFRLMTASGERSQEFLARVSPLELDGTPLLVLTLQDISDRKRREALESVFLHDLMNTLNAIAGFRTLTEEQLISNPHFLGELGSLIDRALEAVKAQRTLASAERQHLTVNIELTDSQTLVEQLVRQFAHQDCRQHRNLEVECTKLSLETDVALVLRVLTNMLKNALEATAPGQTVTIRCFREEASVVFTVHNPGRIPDEVAFHIFERSFSTKGESGRGLGTYSMKLFGERYLHGKVSFSTSEGRGTEFALRLPRSYPGERDTLVRLRTR